MGFIVRGMWRIGQLWSIWIVVLAVPSILAFLLLLPASPDLELNVKPVEEFEFVLAAMPAFVAALAFAAWLLRRRPEQGLPCFGILLVGVAEGLSVALMGAVAYLHLW